MQEFWRIETVKSSLGVFRKPACRIRFLYDFSTKQHFLYETTWFSTISLRNNIFSTKQHFLSETTFSLRNNMFSPKQHVLSAKQHVLYETKIFSTKLHNKYQYNLIYHLASSTEKEVLKVVFKVSKEVSKSFWMFHKEHCCFQKNIVVSKRTLLLRKVVCCRFLCEFHTGCFKNAWSLHEDILMRFPTDQRQHQRKANNKCLKKTRGLSQKRPYHIADMTAKFLSFFRLDLDTVVYTTSFGGDDQLGWWWHDVWDRRPVISREFGDKPVLHYGQVTWKVLGDLESDLHPRKLTCHLKSDYFQ